MIYSLYGQPASGKTTLGERLAKHLNTPFFIDGDAFKGIHKLRAEHKFGREGCEEHFRNANIVATYLDKRKCWLPPNVSNKHSEKWDVVLSFVNPYECLRDELKASNENKVVEILLTSERRRREEYHWDDFEIGNPMLSINTDSPVDLTWENLIVLIDKKNYNIGGIRESQIKKRRKKKSAPKPAGLGALLSKPKPKLKL